MQTKKPVEQTNQGNSQEEENSNTNDNSYKEGGNYQHQRRNNGNKLYKPKYVSCKNYLDLEEVVRVFPHLKNINEKNTEDFSQINKAYAFVLRSNNDDDIHQAIKYGVWTSLPANNIQLKETFRKAHQEQVDVYLFFTVNQSNQYSGVCRMGSDYLDQDFYFWWAGSRYRTFFRTDWIFIKDINFKQFEDISAMIIHGDKREKQPVTKAIDGTELEWETCGKQMMNIFQNAKSTPNIFNEFAYMDERERYLRSTRSSFGNNMMNGGGNNNQNGGGNGGGRGGDRRNNYQSHNNMVGYGQYGMQYGMQYGQPYYPYSYYPMNYGMDPNAALGGANKGVSNIYPPSYYTPGIPGSSLYPPTDIQAPNSFPQPIIQFNSPSFTPNPNIYPPHTQNNNHAVDPQNNPTVKK